MMEVNIHNVVSMSIERKELVVQADAHYSTHVVVKVRDGNGNEYRIRTFAPHHDNYTDAGKELQLDRPIFIEHADSLTNVFNPKLQTNGYHKTEDAVF